MTWALSFYRAGNRHGAIHNEVCVKQSRGISSTFTRLRRHFKRRGVRWKVLKTFVPRNENSVDVAPSSLQEMLSTSASVNKMFSLLPHVVYCPHKDTSGWIHLKLDRLQQFISCKCFLKMSLKSIQSFTRHFANRRTGLTLRVNAKL